jgi:hypothetical protein
MKVYGSQSWLIPDTYLGSVSKLPTPTHEAICVLNTSGTDAEIALTLFFEDRDPIIGEYYAVCGAMRTNHIRLDRLVSSKTGELIPRDVPYSILVESNVPIVVQYSRLDTSGGTVALMTTIPYEG